MSNLTLYLLRHAEAEARRPGLKDSQRPLTPKGQQQAEAVLKALQRLDIRFDRLCSSPYRRARETAEPLAARLPKARELELLDSLTSDTYQQLLADITTRLEPGESHVALVGHEPYLHELASLLLSGDPQRVNISLKKATLLELIGRLEPARMSLSRMLGADVAKHLRH